MNGLQNVVTVGVNPADTSTISAYVANVPVATLVSVLIANLTASPVAATVQWFDASTGASYALMFGKSIPANDAVQVEFAEGMQLVQGDEIRIKAGTGAALSAIINVIETPGRSG